MTKFKVGDKVRILDVMQIEDAIEWGFKNGEIYDVVEIDERKHLYISNGEQWFQLLNKELQYIEKVCEPTNHQRITALEKEVAELRSLKEKVEYLEQAVQQYFTVPSETSTAVEEVSTSTVEDNPKTPNELRAEIIEKAKLFIEKHGEGFLFGSDKNSICAAKLEKFQDSLGYGACIGYSRCHRDDVFNEHIGKAIALGRALGLDVSEFEQAVRPTDIIKGMEIMFFNYEGNKYKSGVITKYNKKKDSALLMDEKLYSPLASKSGCCHRVKKDGFKILNDTNAQYGGGE